MIDKNRSEFEKCNIVPWHEAEHIGKGSMVVVLDSSHKPYPHTNAIDPFHDNISSFGHKSQVAQVIREVAPEAKVVVFSWFKDRKEDILDWIKDHEDEIDAINCSFNSRIQTEIFEQLEHVDIPILVSSGNGYKDSVGSGASLPWTIAVGAWEEHRDNRAAYCNYGEELDIVAYTNIHIRTTSETNTLMFNGTSCAAPMVSGMLAIYNGWLKENGLRKLSREEAKEFILGNVIDKDTKGFDVYSGHGLFILPKSIPEIKPIPIPEEQPEPTPEEEYTMAEFKDTKGRYSEGAIAHAVEKGILKGYPDGSFQPEKPVTREELAVVVARMTGYVEKK